MYITLPKVTKLKYSHPRRTAFMQYRMRQAKREGRPYRIRYYWQPLRRIPLLLQRCVTLGEDASFWRHHGVDWYELRQALWQNWRYRRIKRGGSTITQQLAKNLYLYPERTLWRKLREILIAFRLEKHLSKWRILELYLNVIELGRGIFGVEAASRFYFHKTVSDLFPPEMVLLAATIPAPLRSNPGVPNRALAFRARVILNRLYRYKVIDDSVYTSCRQKLGEWFLENAALQVEF